MRGLIKRLVPSPRRNIDLILLFFVFMVAQPLVPLEHWLARDDLMPWCTLCLVGIGVLRSNTLGLPPQPSLVPKEGGWWARQCSWILPGMVPFTLLMWYDAARLLQGWNVLFAGILSVILLMVGFMSRSHRITAWEPRGWPDGLVWTLRAIFAAGTACILGFFNASVAAWAPDIVSSWLTWLPASALLGLQFHSLGVIHDAPRTSRQRRASGRRDGHAYSPPWFKYTLALVGPSSGLFALALLHTIFDPLSFSQGVVVIFHVLAWAAVLWTKPIPVAMTCVLHEIVPQGGGDSAPEGIARSFEEAPRGAMRLSAREVRRLRVIHLWVVKVTDPRLESLDDPVRPLWTAPPPPISSHILGEAAFEPDEASQLPQWEEIQIALADQRDINALGEGSSQQRRLAVLRAFTTPIGALQTETRTYRWEPVLPRSARQVVDATTTHLTLKDGDILVLSVEGVARAFELEIGSPIYNLSELGNQRPPQLEDYVKFG